MTSHINQPLAYERMRNAPVQVFSNPILGSPPDHFIGGPVLEDEGRQVFRHHRWKTVADKSRKGETYNTKLDGEFAYGGPIVLHFGHMIAEMVHRIVPSRKLLKSTKFLFVGAAEDKFLQDFDLLPAHMKSIFQFFGLNRATVQLVNCNCVIDTLAITQQGFTLGGRSNEQYLDMMGDFTEDRLAILHDEKLPSEKVYVCGKNEPGGNILGEQYVQQLLEKAGFWIFRPEVHSFSFQLYVYSKAKQIVFSEGSAVHSTSLLGRNAMDDVTLIVRRPSSAGMFKENLYGHYKNLDVALVSSFLGTIVKDPTHLVAAKHLGVSIYNIESLKYAFTSKGIWQFYSFDREAYYKQCEIDLETYIKYFLGRKGAFLGTEMLYSLLTRYHLSKLSEVN